METIFFPLYKLKYYIEIFYPAKDKKPPNNQRSFLLSVKIIHPYLYGLIHKYINEFKQATWNSISRKTVTAGIWLDCDLPKN